MASKAWNEAIALQGLGSALSAFARSKAEKRAAQQQQMNFEAQLAQKALELESAKRNQMWQTQLDALKLTQPQTIYSQDKRTGQLIPQTVPGTSMEQLRGTLPGLFQAEASPLAPAPKVVAFGVGAGAGTGSGGGQDEFWKTFDREFAKTAQEWETRGRAEAQANVQSLDNVAQQFETGDIESRARAVLPGRAIIAPKVDQAVKTVEKVIFPQLRRTMGAQFTEKEGKRVIDATIDPAAPAKNNAARVRALEALMKRQNEAIEAMTAYAKKNGTMKGYNGPQQVFTNTDELISALDSIQKTIPSAAPTQKSGPAASESDPLGLGL